MKYKYPSWVTPGGNIKAGAERITGTIASLASEVEQCVAYNETECWRRSTMRGDLLALSEQVYGADHKIYRQIKNSEPPKPYDLRKLFYALTKKVEAVAAQKETARVRRVRAQIRKMPDQDWPAK